MKALAYIGGFLALMGCLYAIWDNGGDFRENKLKLNTTTAVNVQLNQALKERDDANAKLQAIEDEIYNAPAGDDGPLAPVLARELDRVQ